MTTPGVLYGLFERVLGVPSRTTQDHVRRLRADPGLMRQSAQGYGAQNLTTSEAANALVSIATAMANTRKSADAAERVRMTRAGKLIDSRKTAATATEQHDSPYTLCGLSVERATTLGEAIDGLIDDARSGDFQKWATQREGFARIFLKFCNGGARVMLGIERQGQGVTENARLVFRFDGHPGDVGAMLMTNVTEVDGHILTEIAEALGPPA